MANLYKKIQKIFLEFTKLVIISSGMAVVHRGETVSGTAGQFGGESNKLLKELIAQNASLMGKLTNKVGDLALSS